MGAMVTFGGCFTCTTWLEVKTPHGLVTASVMVYEPASLKTKLGFAEVSDVPFVKFQEEDVPQKSPA